MMTSKRSRRSFLAAVSTAATFPMLNFGSFAVLAGGQRKYSKRVVTLMERAQVLDMLGVLTVRFSPTYWTGKLPEEDAQALRDSGVTVLHNSIGSGGSNAYAMAMNYFAMMNGFIARNSELLLFVDRVADIDRAKRTGKIAIVLGLQNAEHFRTVDDVKSFYDLGQRCSQLTYNSQNYYGSGSTDRADGGVSDAGVRLIEKMNEVGMLVDVSHSGDRTTLDAIQISKKPIAITHSNCRALNDHPRLKTDEAIRKLAAKGGVMGISGVRNFVRDQEPTTVEHIVDHIDHVVKLVGIEHVGLGTDSDLNGYDDMSPEEIKRAKSFYDSRYRFRDKLDTDGFDDPLRFYDLTEALVRRGYSDAHIEAILGGNFRRLLAQVWAS
jgi:membrane dipeptidase